MHFGGKIFTSILLTKETQVVFMWKWILCPLVHIETSCQKKTYPKRVCTKRLTRRSKSGYIVRMCISTSCQNTYQRRFLTKSPECVFEHVLSTFTCIWEISNCQINLRVYENHTHTRHSPVCDKRRLQTCRPQTCRLADLQTCRLPDLQTCRHVRNSRGGGGG